MNDLGLWAVTPLDGRYRDKVRGLGELVGEGALIAYRTRVEAQWLLHLADEPAIAADLVIPPAGRALLQQWSGPLTTDWQQDVKDIERTTNHDVKAVEYFMQQRLAKVGVESNVLAFLHFACTSEDINNLAYGLMLKELRTQRLLPLMDEIVLDLADKAEAYSDLAMLARTHGQTASPTTMGKELAVFGRRLLRQRRKLAELAIEGKINGAVGNYNAHRIAFPGVNWPDLARRFVEQKLGLSFNPLTTQIENHDSLVEYAETVRHFNTIAIGLCRDLWSYISVGYFRQQTKASEVGSSTMPHKVNPIDFENAEGNLGLANAMAAHFSDKLPISRWQRDLSDSTVLRAIGTLFGHTELAWRSLLRGLSKIVADRHRISTDLDGAWEVLAEPVQTVMRRHGMVDAYEMLKAATRGKSVTKEVLDSLVMACPSLPESARQTLRALTPGTYLGDAEALAMAFVTAARKGELP